MIIHIILKKEDADIIYWRNFLPPKQFGQFVNYILEAEHKGAIALLPVPEEWGEGDAPIDLRFSVKLSGAKELVNKLPMRKRSTTIKELIRKHLQLNIARVERIATYTDEYEGRYE